MAWTPPRLSIGDDGSSEGGGPKDKKDEKEKKAKKDKRASKQGGKSRAPATARAEEAKGAETDKKGAGKSSTKTFASGWKAVTSVRASGTSKGKTDTLYYDPKGVQYGSLKKAQAGGFKGK